MSSEHPIDPRVARTRDAVLAAAADELVERGFQGFTIDGVVARSGVAKTTLYRHWPAKADLLQDVVRNLHQLPPLPDTGSLRGDLQLIIGGLVEALWVLQDQYLRALPALMDAAERDPELADLHARITAERSSRIRDVLQRGLRSGDLRKGIDIDLAVTMLAGPPLLRRFLMRQPMHPDETRALIDSVLLGIAAPGSRDRWRSRTRLRRT